MINLKNKAKIWFCLVIWLIITISLGFGLSFSYDMLIGKNDWSGFSELFQLMFPTYFHIFFLPTLVAITVMVFRIELPYRNMYRLRYLFFGMIIPLNILVILFHSSFTFHKLPRSEILIHSILYLIVLIISLTVLFKIGFPILSKLNIPKPLLEKE